MEKEEKKKEKEGKKFKQPTWLLQTVTMIALLLSFLCIGYAIGTVRTNENIKEKVITNNQENNEGTIKPSVEETKENTEKTNKENVEVSEQNGSSSQYLSEEQALELGNKLWTKAYDTFWGSETVWKRHLSEVPNQYGGYEYICDVTKDEVKSGFARDFEGYECTVRDAECRKISLSEFVGENVSDCQGGGQRGGLQTYKTTTLKVKNISETHIEFTAVSEYCDNSFCSTSNETVETIEKPFTIVNYGNDAGPNWVIGIFYLPN